MTILNLLLSIVVVGLLTVLLPRAYEHIIYDRRAKARGCKPPIRDFSSPLGIPALYQTVRAFMKNDLLEHYRFQFDGNNVDSARKMMGGMMWFGTRDPENIKAMLATSFKDYSLGFRYEAMYPLLGKGIFTLSGDAWKHSRALLRPQFSREQVSRINTLHHHVGLLVERLASGEEVDAQALFHTLTLDTATEFLFGVISDSMNDDQAIQDVQGGRMVSGAQFAESFARCLETIAYRIIASRLYWAVDSPQFRRDVKVCHKFVDYFVQKALEKPMQPDEVSERYVFINELTKETHNATVIRDQAFNILLAGRDTTASLLSFTTMYLAIYKDIWNDLRNTILEEFGTDDESVTFESLKRCKPLQNVINEVLRLHPIVPMNFRTAIRDTILPRGGGPDGSAPVFVPKGTNCFYNVYAMHRNHKIWGPDADEFKPSRWEKGLAVGWEYIPFNGGPRICLGQQFALTEAAYTILRICQKFKDIELISPDPHSNPAFVKMWMRLTVSVDGGVRARFIPA